MEIANKDEKRKISKLFWIILIVMVLIISFTLGYVMLKNKDFFDITKILNANKEHTILLNEFIVNIQSENNKKSYLKIEMALMYTNKKDGELIESNINKIRDIIINNLMDKSSSEILDVENIKNFKVDIKKKINDELKSDLIKDVYLTNLVIQ